MQVSPISSTNFYGVNPKYPKKILKTAITDFSRPGYSIQSEFKAVQQEELPFFSESALINTKKITEKVHKTEEVSGADFFYDSMRKEMPKTEDAVDKTHEYLSASMPIVD